MISSYLTVAGAAEAEIAVKRSRFRCRVQRVDSEGAARTVVERIRKQDWDARHHCSAFVLGPDASVQRSSDDGEPSGSAGAPMLEVLLGRGLSDVVAVVSRWFGGVLLGAGGLVRAYGDAVRLAVDEAGVRERRLLHTYDVSVAHAAVGRLESDLRVRDVVVLGADYAEQATLRLAVPAGGEARFETLLGELTGGSAVPRFTGESWTDA